MDIVRITPLVVLIARHGSGGIPRVCVAIVNEKKLFVVALRYVTLAQGCCNSFIVTSPVLRFTWHFFACMRVGLSHVHPSTPVCRTNQGLVTGGGGGDNLSLTPTRILSIQTLRTLRTTMPTVTGWERTVHPQSLRLVEGSVHHIAHRGPQHMCR